MKDEIDAVRVTLARILDYVNGIDVSKIDAEDYAAIVSLVAKNAATVARLMQVDKALNDSQNVGVHAQLLAALEEVNANLSLQ